MTIFKICKFRLVLLLVLTIVACNAQERYLNSVYTEIEKKTYTYADTLKLDFYSAKSDTTSLKPLLILVHGGGFGSGKRDNPLERRFSEDIAKKGYAVASISYRLTQKGKSFGCDCPSQEKIETFLAVSEDILKATRFLVKKAADLKFDKQKIILVGSSAGAEAVLNTAFLKYHRDFQKLSYDDIKFAGVISFAGAVMNADYITSTNAVPILLFHGEKDNLVPFGTAAHHFCDSTAPGFLLLDGSRTIAQRLELLNTPYTLVYDPNGNHAWANLPYTQIDLIANFIKTMVIDGEHHQTKIKTASKK